MSAWLAALLGFVAGFLFWPALVITVYLLPSPGEE